MAGALWCMVSLVVCGDLSGVWWAQWPMVSLVAWGEPGGLWCA